MFPNYALIVLAAVLVVSALVWTIGARLRVRRGEAALVPFRSMMGRGLFAPAAMIFMAADFSMGPVPWVAWVALVFGSWLVTLAVVRAAVGTLTPASVATASSQSQETVAAPEKRAAASVA